MRPWNQTLGGHALFYEEPASESINLFDIASALAKINRFNGHTTRPLSVAEHSIGVSFMLPESKKLAGLLHDAAEAYVGDMAAPLKRLCPNFVEIEKRIHELIAKKWDVDFDSPLLKQADLDAVVTECALLKGGQVEPWGISGAFHWGYGNRLRLSNEKPWTHWRDEWLHEVQSRLQH